ncbi:MAG: DUF2812 domain-containing protein [Treponema sp.]|nr:DUF2812 domain-containing protein [Treponema sp.]
MKDKKTVFKFFSLFEYEEEEKYLEKQHKNGWKVTGFTLPGFYKFEKCQPEDVCYRIDFTDERGPQSQEYRQLFADNGWEFLWAVNGFTIFRKPSSSEQEGGKEIFTDKESKINMLLKIQKRRLLPLLVIFLCAVLPNLAKGLNGEFGRGPFESGMTIFFLIMFFLYSYIFVKSFIKIKELKKKLE